MQTSHDNATTGLHGPVTFDSDDRSHSRNKLVSFASLSSSSSSSSLDEHFNPFIDKADDADRALTSTSVNAASNHFNPFRDDTNIPASMPAFGPDQDRRGSDFPPTSTFPTTQSSSNIPDSVPNIDIQATRSPAVQIMERPSDDASSYRIPDYVFQRNKSRAPKEWSTASNESLFSIQMGHTSFAGDLFMYKSGELGMNNKKSGELTAQKSNKSGEFRSYSSSWDLGYSKSVDIGWYNLSGELATPRQTTSGSVQMNSSSGRLPHPNASNNMGAKATLFSNGFYGGEPPNIGTGVSAPDAVVAEAVKEQNHNLLGSPSLAIGFTSPSTASHLDERASSTKSFTFPVLTKQDKSQSSLTPNSIQSNNQQHPLQQPQASPPEANIHSSTNNTENRSSFFSCFSCCPLRI